MSRRYIVLLMALLSFAGALAQDDAPPPVITADNVRDLAPARTVRFDELDLTPDGDAAIPLSGWFTLSSDGLWAAFVVKAGVKILATGPAFSQLGWVSDFSDTTVIDARWHNEFNDLVVIYEREGTYYLSIGVDGARFVKAIPPIGGIPVRVWWDASDFERIWLELTPAPEDPDRSGFQVVRIDLDNSDAEPFALPTGPEHDFDSFVRIGRIPAPLAITATFAGTVRRWNLETGEVTAEVEMPVAPTFGRVNETNGVHFAWRDEMSTALHLLNFETGEDREIAPLDGEYIQALLLTPDADVILAVHRGETPDVTAWIVETGEEIALGEYDTTICSRVPDMVQLARNGTRLVIGCEDGYQVWEVSE